VMALHRDGNDKMGIQEREPEGKKGFPKGTSIRLKERKKSPHLRWKGVSCCLEDCGDKMQFKERGKRKCRGCSMEYYGLYMQVARGGEGGCTLVPSLPKGAAGTGTTIPSVWGTKVGGWS